MSESEATGPLPANENDAVGAPTIPPAAPTIDDQGNSVDPLAKGKDAVEAKNKGDSSSSINNEVSPKQAESSTTEAPVVAVVVESASDLADKFKNMAFGNKSLDELHRIQSRPSHLTAGILFSDPSLKM